MPGGDEYGGAGGTCEESNGAKTRPGYIVTLQDAIKEQGGKRKGSDT